MAARRGHDWLNGWKARPVVALALGLVLLGWWSIGSTTARAAVFSNTSSIALNDPNSQVNGKNNATASPYPSTIAVSGQSGTISNVTLTLSNVSYGFSDDIDVLLVGPEGQTLIPIAAVGPNTGTSEAANNSTLTLSDAGTLPTATTAWGANPTFKPANFGQGPFTNETSYNGFNEVFESPAPAGPWGDPGQTGSGATLASTFDGTNPNGTWSLYVITTSGGDGTGSIAGGWSLNITTASAVSTTTTLVSNNNPSFASGANSSVTLTATVTSSGSPVSEGTVAFTDGATTISGCDAQAVSSSGQATCTTAFATEGAHSIHASYGGTANFGPSSATVSQQVDNHTTVTGNSYCNPGAMTLNNPTIPPGDASPYPSHVFVSGLAGTLSHLTVTLNGVTYPFSQDIDALLVGPGGQTPDPGRRRGARTRTAASAIVTLTLDDAATSTVSQTGIWGAPNSTVTSKPFNYGGLDEIWGSPAPAGPYGNPGPNGGGTATLGSTFDGTNPNGTWSLYVITTAAGDGTGAIAGGWCVNTTIQKAALTIGSQASPSSATIGDPISDTATFSGVPQGADAPTGSVTFNAYGPNDATCSNPPAFTTTASLSGAGTSASSGNFTPPVPGTYRWTASYGGDSNYSSETTGCDDPNEAVVVSQAAPSLSSTASSSVTIGGAISDTVMLSGGHNPTGTLTFAAYGSDDPTCANLPAFSASVPVAGDGTYASNSFVPSEAGRYRFVATYSGDSNNSAVLSKCGDTGESVVVSQASPSLSTAASAPVTLGGAVSDTATLSGGDSPTGTITFAAYGPNDPTCANTAAFSATVPIAGPGVYTSPNFAPGTAGTYEFVATYNGDTNNSTVSSSCGAPGESVVVTSASPIFTSTVPATATTAGNPISDTATFSGVPQGADAPTGSVTFNAYGPNDATCSNPPAFTTTASLSGAGTSASSGNFTPPVPGTYRWTASYGGDSNYSSQTTTCNDPNETVVVNQAIPSLSSTASPSVTVGGAVSDTATLSGGDNPSGTVMFKLFGPGDPTCVGSPIFTSKVNTVNGNGTYASDPFTASTSGTYRWVVTYSGDANNQGASAACGTDSESVAVTAATTQVKLASSVNPSAPGQPVTFTATVAGRSPTGTVTFKDGANTLGTGAVDSNGTAALTTSSLGVGSHSVTAVYGGDTNNRGTTSDAITQVVSAPSSNVPPSISIASPISGARYRYGQSVRARYACSAVADGPAVRFCTGTVPNGSRIDTHRPGIHTFSVTAADNAGQSVVKTVVYRVRPSNRAAVSRIGAHADGSVRFRLRLPGTGRGRCAGDGLDRQLRALHQAAPTSLQGSASTGARAVRVCACARHGAQGGCDHRDRETEQRRAQTPGALPLSARDQALGQFHPDRRHAARPRVLRPAVA